MKGKEVLGVGCWVLVTSHQRPEPNTLSYFILHPSAFILKLLPAGHTRKRKTTITKANTIPAIRSAKAISR